MLMLSYLRLLNAYVFVQALTETSQFSLLSLHSWGPRQSRWGSATKPFQSRPALTPHKSAEPYIILEIPRHYDPVYEIIICRIYPNAFCVCDCICKSIIWTNRKKMPWPVQWGLKERILSCWGTTPYLRATHVQQFASRLSCVAAQEKGEVVGFQVHFPRFPSQIIFVEWPNNWTI